MRNQIWVSFPLWFCLYFVYIWKCVPCILLHKPKTLNLPNNCTTLFKTNATVLSFISVERHLAFNLGNNADLICSDKTWNETLYIIWNIKSNNKECKIAFSDDGRSEDTCRDGKSLQNTSSAQSYLHIPNFSNGDVGVYKCECVYNGGIANYRINVAITGTASFITKTCNQKGHFTQITHTQTDKIANSAYS